MGRGQILNLFVEWVRGRTRCAGKMLPCVCGVCMNDQGRSNLTSINYLPYRQDDAWPAAPALPSRTWLNTQLLVSTRSYMSIMGKIRHTIDLFHLREDHETGTETK